MIAADTRTGPSLKTLQERAKVWHQVWHQVCECVFALARHRLWMVACCVWEILYIVRLDLHVSAVLEVNLEPTFRGCCCDPCTAEPLAAVECFGAEPTEFYQRKAKAQSGTHRYQDRSTLDPLLVTTTVRPRPDNSKR